MVKDNTLEWIAFFMVAAVVGPALWLSGTSGADLSVTLTFMGYIAAIWVPRLFFMFALHIYSGLLTVACVVASWVSFWDVLDNVAAKRSGIATGFRLLSYRKNDPFDQFTDADMAQTFWFNHALTKWGVAAAFVALGLWVIKTSNGSRRTWG